MTLGTELPRVEGPTHHTVPRVRNWQRLHHQVYPGCLPRKTKNMSVRGPKGRVSGGQDKHQRQETSPA